jgi:ABC-type nickel/cobalt efflux system permease component RcnA
MNILAPLLALAAMVIIVAGGCWLVWQNEKPDDEP